MFPHLGKFKISNFSKKGYRSLHNLKYWNCEEYLGFGPGAHSYFGGKRFSFKKDINLYIDSFDAQKEVSEKLLDEYIDISKSGKVWITELEAREKEETGIKNLKLPEDTEKEGNNEVQELINKYNKVIDEKLKEKETELMSI